MIRIAYLLIIFSFLFIACEKEKTVKTPEITDFSVNKTTIVVGDSIAFTVTSDAEKGVIWFGDATSDYSIYKELIANPDTSKNKTKSYPKGTSLATMDGVKKLYHTYKNEGTFTVVLIVSNIGNYGKDIVTTEKEISITITK